MSGSVRLTVLNRRNGWWCTPYGTGSFIKTLPPLALDVKMVYFTHMPPTAAVTLRFKTWKNLLLFEAEIYNRPHEIDRVKLTLTANLSDTEIELAVKDYGGLLLN